MTAPDLVEMAPDKIGLLSGGASSGELAPGGAAGIYRGPGGLPAVSGGSLLGSSHGCDGSDAARLAAADGALRRKGTV